jgi:methyl-accepting chemotaxis protein
MIGALRRLVPSFVRRSYVLKFGISVLVLGLVVGGIGFVGTGQIQDQVEQGVEEDLANIAAQEANSFESWSERNELVARTVSQTVLGETPSFKEEILDNSLDNDEITPGGVGMHVIDMDQNSFVASTAGVNGSLSSNQMEQFWTAAAADLEPSALEGTRIVDAGMLGGDTPAVVYASRVQSSPLQATTPEALIYVVDLEQFAADVERETGRVTYIVDAGEGGSREIVYDSSGESYFDRYRGLDVVSGARNASAGGSAGTGVAPARGPDKIVESSAGAFDGGEKYIPSYASLDLAGEADDWAVVVHTPRSAAFGFVDTIQQFGFLATVGGVVLIGLFGVVIGRNTSTAIDRLRRKSEEMERGNLDVDFETPRIDSIGQLYDGMASMRDALRNQIMEAREAREEAERARERAEETSEHLQAKANEYRDTMRAVADGDLGRRLEPSERNEAMGEIAEEFNEMIAEIETTVAQLKEFANEVATSSEEVTASAEEVRSASQKVTESIQEISDGAERQDDALQSVAGEMNGLSTTVEEIASLSNQVADLSERTAETGRRGRDAAEEAVEGMNAIEEESRVAVERIQQLDEEMDQIDELVDFITDVANQTNRLALNANIEASRAEGSGNSGFGAVANEIKDLAAETKEATEDMEDSVSRVQRQADRAVESVTATGELIQDNTDSVRNAIEALDEIAEYAQETNTGVQEISAATEQQAASTQQVVAMVDEAATISEATSQEAENVAAAAEEQTTAMTEVSDSASELSGQASRLSEALDRFRTESDGGSLDDIGGGDGVGAAETPGLSASAAVDEAGTEFDESGFDGDDLDGGLDGGDLDGDDLDGLGVDDGSGPADAEDGGESEGEGDDGGDDEPGLGDDAATFGDG